MEFGKYKGINFKYIPRNYFFWFETNVMNKKTVNEKLLKLQKKYITFFKLVDYGEIEHTPEYISKYDLAIKQSKKQV